MSLLYYFILFILGGVAETLLHVCLKRSTLEHLDARGIRYYLCIIKDYWFYLGMLFYIVDLVIYMYLLAHLPLSVAYPITGLQKIFIIFSSRYLLKEQLSSVEFVGVSLIGLGILLIAGAQE
ncbi:DMT family transporter [Legionella fallonii]|uniref:Uncharacterized protein n=1 Tax=Legionella fallonii LLAP-10 TaxID=1212491 RepID=A0A098GB93_9GAMM|nr:EamA family transporter [Legionella fallonii]CEG58741.1 membrane protein of unknown function [Legionella fallonii LLAP-10]